MIKKSYYESKFNNSNIISGFFTKYVGLTKNTNSPIIDAHNAKSQINKMQKEILIAQKKIKLNKSKLKIINQIHSNKVIMINKRNFSNNFYADGMITKDKNISLAILTADCCPIFIFDKDSSFICCLHSGWKGCYLNIIKVALNKIKKIQSDLSKIYAVIGPCLHQTNFETDNTFKKKFISKNPFYKKFFIDIKDGQKSLFDMKELIKYQLKINKIKNIEDLDIDTYINTKIFYSHRRSTHDNTLPTGRMVNIIGFAP